MGGVLGLEVLTSKATRCQWKSIGQNATSSNVKLLGL